MRSLKKITLILAVTALWKLTLLGEQLPAGTYTNAFSGTAALYDLSGTYSQSFGGLTLSGTVNMDSAGKFTGAGTADLSNLTSYGVSGKIEAAFGGAVKSANNTTRVGMTVKMKAYLAAEGHTVRISANTKENMVLDQVNRQLSGTVSGTITVSAPGYGSWTQKIPETPFQRSLPGSGDGSWDLNFDLAPVGKKYAGAGTIALAGGTSYPVTVTGNYAKDGTSKLTVRGEKSMNLALVAAFQNGQFQLQSLKGKALGQRPYGSSPTASTSVSSSSSWNLGVEAYRSKIRGTNTPVPPIPPFPITNAPVPPGSPLPITRIPSPPILPLPLPPLP